MGEKEAHHLMSRVRPILIHIGSFFRSAGPCVTQLIDAPFLDYNRVSECSAREMVATWCSLRCLRVLARHGPVEPGQQLRDDVVRIGWIDCLVAFSLKHDRRNGLVRSHPLRTRAP
jgi:hypothetical protein